MALKFAFNLPDGSVTILGAAPKDQLEKVIGTPTMVDGVMRRVLTDEEYKNHVLSRNIEKGVIPADAVDLVELSEDWVAPDRTYRAAWTKTGTTFDHDMVKARAIHMDRIRVARNAKLDETDKQVLALDGAPIPPALSTLRQKLRDLPQTVNLGQAQNVNALKAIWPQELN